MNILLGAGSVGGPRWSGSFYPLDDVLADTLSGKDVRLGGPGSESYTTGKIGHGYTGDGVTYIDHANPLIAPGLTVTAWVKYLSNPGDSVGNILSTSLSSFANLFNLKAQFASGVLTTQFEATGVTFGDATLALDSWQHLVLTTDGSGVATAYRDGALVGTQACALGPFLVGAWTLQPLFGGTVLDLVGVFPRAFSPADVAAYYNGGAGYDPTA